MFEKTLSSMRPPVLSAGMTMIICVTFLVCFFYVDRSAHAAQSCVTEVPAPDEDIFTIKGTRVKVIEGDLYVCRDSRWKFEKTLVRNVAKDVEVKRSADGCEMVNTSTGERVTLSRQYSTGFEKPSFLDLFSMEDWTGTTLLSPKADTVKEYMELNRRILQGGDFLDNRIDLVGDNVHSGSHALRFYAVEPGWTMNTSKSLVEKKNLCFGKGDDLWFSGWFYLEKNVPATLFDFETRRMQGGPGIRLFIRQKKYASMELKFIVKPQYNQTSVSVPLGRWFHIKLHLRLSNHDDGLIEMWQDGTRILSMNGQTLPTNDSVYHVMQLGITATPREAAVVADDIAVSNMPL